MSDLASASFDFYDGVRILLPGALVAGLYQAVVSTFSFHAPLPSADALSAITLLSVAGLSLYYMDLPARSVLYPKALPHNIFTRWKVAAPAGRSAQNVYFVMMDTVMPPAIRSRAQYYNSMYRIGFELIVMFCLAGPAVATAALLSGPAAKGSDPSGAQTVMGVACVLLGLLAACALATALLNANDRESPGETPIARRAATVLKRLGEQVPCGDRALIAAAAVLSAIYALTHAAGFLIAAVAIASGWWSFRYLRGRFAPRAGSAKVPLARRLSAAERRNLEASTSTLAVCLTALLVWIPAALHVAPDSHLSVGAALGWSAVTLSGAVLMLFRGHERKLWGAYYTVATWMEVNREKILAEYGLSEPADGEG